MLIEEAKGVGESETETADESSTESSQENQSANISTSDESETAVEDRESSVSLQLEEASANSVELSSSDSSEAQDESDIAVMMQDDQPSIESVFEKFNGDVKRTKYALKQWIVVSQSTFYISNVITALVPRLRLPAS